MGDENHAVRFHYAVGGVNLTRCCQDRSALSVLWCDMRAEEAQFSGITDNPAQTGVGRHWHVGDQHGERVASAQQLAHAPGEGRRDKRCAVFIPCW